MKTPDFLTSSLRCAFLLSGSSLLPSCTCEGMGLASDLSCFLAGQRQFCRSTAEAIMTKPLAAANRRTTTSICMHRSLHGFTRACRTEQVSSMWTARKAATSSPQVQLASERSSCIQNRHTTSKLCAVTAYHQVALLPPRWCCAACPR